MNGYEVFKTVIFTSLTDKIVSMRVRFELQGFPNLLI